MASNKFSDIKTIDFSDYEEMIFDFYMGQPIPNLVSEYKRYSQNTACFTELQARLLKDVVASKFFSIFSDI